MFALCWCQRSFATLTGQYLFEEGAGPTAFDTSGNDRNGADTNGPTYVPGLYAGSNYALRFNSTGPSAPNPALAQSVILPNDTDFIRNAPGATLMAWVRLDGTSIDQTILSIKNGTTGLGAPRAQLYMTNFGSSLRFAVGGSQVDGNISNGIVSSTPILTGQTYFVAGVLDFVNGSVAIYVNGIQDNFGGVIGWNGNSANTANRFSEIGAYAPPSLAPGSREYWQGVIDGARIFDQALSSAQILGLYQNPDTVPVVPEPATVTLFAAVAFAFTMARRRR
jgi:hypothetical protein